MKLLLFLFLFLLLALCTGPGHALRLRRPMWAVPEPKTWQDAQQHCRASGRDLLTALSQDELLQMDLSPHFAWIGMYGHDGHYHWGDINNRDVYNDPRPVTSWGPLDRTSTIDGDDCVLTKYQTNTTFHASCHDRHFFFCNRVLFDVFVPVAMSASDAQRTCATQGLSTQGLSTQGLSTQGLSTQGLSMFLEKSSPRWPGSPFYVAREFPVWIGLHCNGGSWKWSDQNKSDFRNWAPDLGAPPSASSSDCVVVSSQSKFMSVQSCSKAFPFLCYRHNVVLVQELLSWEQALETCSNLRPSSSSFRLLKVQENLMESIKNVLRFTTTTKVWVGLRFLGGSWFWTDGGAVSLSFPQCPVSGLHCGALVHNGTSESDIEPSDCSQRLNVLCYGDP